MSDPPPPERPLPEVLDQIRAAEELEELRAMDRAVLEKELVDDGYDPARLRERIAAARAAAYAEPVAKDAPPAKAAGKVVDLAARRAEKAAASTRWGLFAAAAAVALLAGGSGAQYAATRMPARTVEYPTVVLPPPPGKLAAPVRQRAFRLCALGYYGECEDALDEARDIDPEGENDATVNDARSAISAAHLGEQPGGAHGLFVKPPVFPTERRLQRHP